MVSQIQSSDSLILKQSLVTSPNLNNVMGTRVSAVEQKQDSFESQNQKQKKGSTALNVIMLGITGASVTAMALTKRRLGDIIKFVGQDVPKTTGERLSRIFRLASVDSMTGLFNKQSLVAQIPKEFKEAIKNGEHFSVAMLDMDNFKGINEVFSHEVGDIVLMRIAENINSISKKYGAKAYRYGGEEFVISMKGKKSQEAQKIVEEVAQAIKQDDAIQNYLPKFKEEAGNTIKFINEEIKTFSSVFSKLKSKTKNNQSVSLAKDITSIIENYIEKYNPSDKKVLQEILLNLHNQNPKELAKYLNIQTKVGYKSTLGNELNKIYTQYNWKKPDLEKWVSHLNEHSMFTVSSGIASVGNDSLVTNGMTLVKVADESLNAAKNNGKNISVLANEEMIKEVLKQKYS